jgi:hypothetical protein
LVDQQCIEPVDDDADRVPCLDASVGEVVYGLGDEDGERAKVMPTDRLLLPPGVDEAVGLDGGGLEQGGEGPVVLREAEAVPVVIEKSPSASDQP